MQFLSHQFFTNCDVSRVFGPKSGFLDCMWNGVDVCPGAPSLQMVKVIGLGDLVSSNGQT